MDNRAQKSILQTNTKPPSKGRRISWGEVKIKEFGLDDEVKNQLGDEYNITLADIQNNNTIIEESNIEDSILSINDNIITRNIFDDSILNRNSIDITKPFNSQPIYYRSSVDDYFPRDNNRVTICETNNSNIKNDNARITLIPRIQAIGSNYKDNEFKKRNSFNLRHTLDMLYSNHVEDNSDVISVSPIHNAQKIYYDTKMASASKILEEKRNDRITLYQIYSDKGNTPLQLKKNESDIDRRINGLINYITENVSIREKLATEFERESSEYENKLRELEDEKVVIALRKVKIKQEIERLDKVYIETVEFFKINKYMFRLFGLKIISSEFGTLIVQLFKKINIIFKFDDKINLKFLENSHDRADFIISPKLDFEFVDNFGINNEYAQKLLRNIYDHLISGLYNNVKISVNDFYNNLKRLIKITSAFLYFCEILNICHAASIDLSMTYAKEKKESHISFSLLNKMGFKIRFDFIFSLINPFYGISVKDIQVINLNLSDSNFSKSKNNAFTLINEIKSFFLQIDKLKNPIFFKDFIIKLNKKIFNL
jgi:hypothetical protein